MDLEDSSLFSQETERLATLHNLRRKAIDGPTKKSSTPKWKQGKLAAVEPPRYRGSYHDKD
jgi:hypothetical protein